MSEYAIGRLVNDGTFIRAIQPGEITSQRCGSCSENLEEGKVMDYKLDEWHYCICLDCHNEVLRIKEHNSIPVIQSSMNSAVKEFMKKVKRHEQARVR
jgi:hypothetical protein